MLRFVRRLFGFPRSCTNVSRHSFGVGGDVAAGVCFDVFYRGAAGGDVYLALEVDGLGGPAVAGLRYA